MVSHQMLPCASATRWLSIIMAVALPGVAAHRSSAQRGAELVGELSVQNKTEPPGIVQWVVHFCTHHGPNGKLGLWEDDPEFDEKCKALFHKHLQYCVKVAVAKNEKPKNGRRWEELREMDAACKQFNRELETSRAAAAVDSNVAKAVSACEPQLVGVCLTHCQNKAKAYLEEDVDCLVKCSALSAFHTGTIEACADIGADCLEKHQDQLAAAGRDPALEAIMREMTVKCVCVSLPNAKERCYSDAGLALRPGQKWCEWNDTPSWRLVMERWARNWQEQMPVPECEELPRRG